jgi:hypothetical protein
MKAIRLGHLEGSVWAANEAADKLGDVEGHTVLVDLCRLVQGYPPYAEQFVQRVMTEGKAHDLVVLWPKRHFVLLLEEALAKRGMSDRLSFGPMAMLNIEGLERIA